MIDTEPSSYRGFHFSRLKTPFDSYSTTIIFAKEASDARRKQVTAEAYLKIRRTRERACNDADEASFAKIMERVAGIEPVSKAWESFILPLNYTREYFSYYFSLNVLTAQMMK